MATVVTGATRGEPDLAALGTWLEQRGTTLVGPVTCQLIAGGHSNLTYLVTDAQDRRVVYRRPPLGGVLKSAHDVVREGRILQALQGSAVPVPVVLGVNDDAALGSTFLCMDFVDGHVLRDNRVVAATFAELERAGVARSFVETLAALHAVDPVAVGLGDLAPTGAYLERQLSRWEKQLAATAEQPYPVMETLLAGLRRHAPAETRRRLVHADFRLDNTIIGPEGKVRAVLDWELATLGDPLADLGTMLAFWFEPGEQVPDRIASVPQLPGFPARSTVIEWYQDLTGADVAAAGYFRAFALWRLAVILIGVAKRYRTGVMGEVSGGPRASDALTLADVGLAALAEYTATQRQTVRAT